MATEGQATYRRVRLSVRLGRRIFEGAQDRIDTCLVPRALSLQPLEYVGIEAQRDRSFWWNGLEATPRDPPDNVLHRSLGMFR
jgi:hypothetical protein